MRLLSPDRWTWRSSVGSADSRTVRTAGVEEACPRAAKEPHQTRRSKTMTATTAVPTPTYNAPTPYCSPTFEGSSQIDEFPLQPTRPQQVVPDPYPHQSMQQSMQQPMSPSM